MPTSKQKITTLINKIAIATRHNKTFSCDLTELENAIVETKKLIECNNNFIRVSEKQLQDLKDQEFLRYLHTPCYRYNING